MDELQNATLAQAEEKIDITGKQGRRLNSLKRNKTVTVSGTNGLISAGLLELQTGGTMEQNAATTVLWSDYLTITANASATRFKAVGTAGNEIDTVYIKNPGGTLGAELTQGSAAAAGVFTYDPATKELAFEADAYPDGTNILVFYKRKVNANVLHNTSDTYSGKCELYIDAFGEDKCGNVYHVQIHIPMADFDGNFEITFGDNQAVHAWSATSLSSVCGSSSGAVYFDYTVFGSSAEDVA
jgi:hypothetical protein